MTASVADCLRLVYKGGPDYPYRGMTLWSATQGLDEVFGMLTRLDPLIKAQEALVARAERAYGQNSQGFASEQELLAKLVALKAQHEEHPMSPETLMAQVLVLLIQGD